VIAVSLTPAEIEVGVATDVSLGISNSGTDTCTNIVLRLDFPVQVRHLRGHSRVDVVRLAPGQTTSHTIRLRADTSGTWPVTSSNFSYRDGRGGTQRIPDFRRDLTVVPRTEPPAPPSRRNPALRVTATASVLPLGEWEVLPATLENEGSGAAYDVMLRVSGPLATGPGADRQRFLSIGPGQREHVAIPVIASQPGSNVPVVFELDYTDDSGRRVQVNQVVPVRVSRAASPGDAPEQAMRILFLSADPHSGGGARLRLDEELREIRDRLAQGRFRDRFDLHDRTAVRTSDLSRHLLDVRPRVVHFSGHGTRDGWLVLEDSSGRSQPVPPPGFARLFSLVADSVECVVLNACYSEALGSALAEHIRYVIGMRTAIGDKAALAFSDGFYVGVAAGESIDRAFEFGLAQIMLHGIPEDRTPVLYRQRG
jgi:hypothetical protein